MCPEELQPFLQLPPGLSLPPQGPSIRDRQHTQLPLDGTEQSPVQDQPLTQEEQLRLLEDREMLRESMLDIPLPPRDQRQFDYGAALAWEQRSSLSVAINPRASEYFVPAVEEVASLATRAGALTEPQEQQGHEYEAWRTRNAALLEDVTDALSPGEGSDDDHSVVDLWSGGSARLLKRVMTAFAASIALRPSQHCKIFVFPGFVRSMLGKPSGVEGAMSVLGNGVEDPSLWSLGVNADAFGLLGWQEAVLSFTRNDWIDGEYFEAQSPEVQCASKALLSLQRAVLQKLSLSLPADAKGQFWPAICQFPNLKQLKLVLFDRAVLDSSMLRSLPPLLTDLEVAVADVHIQGSGVLPSLTHLKFGYASKLVVNAFLPSLVCLTTDDVGSVQLVGEQLQLPRLAGLHLDCDEGAVDFGSMPALQELHSCGSGPHAVSGMTALENLEILKFPSIWAGNLRTTASILQQAPAMLRELKVNFHRPCLGQQAAEFAVQLGPALGRFARLDYFASNSTAFLPYLRTLSGLRSLEFWGLPAADLSIQDAEHLAAGFSSLEKLTFLSQKRNTARDLRLQLLASILPVGCSIWESD
ncbi:hypothetical protein N2152v2_004470 [Parachlorella kessleri]